MRMYLASLALAASTVAGPLQAAERPVQVPGPKGALNGTLRSSSSQPPRVAVIIPGSGPTDRDGNNTLGFTPLTYRLLAEGLEAKGVSTVRYDKRGMFQSAAATLDANDVTLAEYAKDAHAWAELAMRETGSSCAWLIGHSEGGLVALVAAKNPKDICGLILLSTPGRKASDVLREQLRANPGNASLLPAAMSAIDTLEAGRRVDSSGLPAALAPLFRPSVQGFMIDLFAHDPFELASGYRGPMLIVSGGRDLQVSGSDAKRLAAAQPGSKLLEIPAMNHVGKAVESDERTANLAAYSDPNLPLAGGLVEAITAFIAEPR